MKKFWQGRRAGTEFTVSGDPFGYSVDTKARVPLQAWSERLASRISMPEDQQHMLEDLARRGTVVYAVKYRSQLDFVYLNLRLHQLGLPPASFLFDLHPYFYQPRWYALKLLAFHFYHLIRRGELPNPYDSGHYREKIKKGESGLLFLLGKRGYYRRAVLVGNDPLELLLEVQRETDRPIFVVPIMLLYTRHPGRERKGMLEVFLGQREQPGHLRKLVAFFRGSPNCVMEAGEALNLQEVLPELAEGPYHRRKQVFEIRRGLIDSVDEIKRAVVGPTLKSKLELKEIILHHPRLDAFMQRRARSQNQEIWRVRKEADDYLEEIAANYSTTLIQVGEKTLNWVWNNLFDGIEVDVDSLQKVKRAARHDTLVYIPCHKSHIDYLVLSCILFQNNLTCPFIAAGKNLSFWPLGPIFRRGGAFFIRRSFKGLKFYSEVFSLYVKTMVQLGHNIEFFIEGGRSRTGKMVLPKLGLLAILIQAVEDEFLDDLVFVPTSISYDRIPEEESYTKEVSGGSKVEENIRQLVRARGFLKKRYGRIYVTFAEPVSLQRYLERYRGDSTKLLPKERHAMYRDFGYRIINSINQATLVTPHALAASALLTSERHGVSKAEFHEVCDVFHSYLNNCGVKLSKTLRNYQASLQDTLWDLERGKIIGKLKDEDDDLEEEVFTMDDSKRLLLEYYKNNLIHFLLPPAYVATSILSQQTFRFSISQVVEDVAFMKNFFKFEFVYDNEVSDEKLVDRVLDSFNTLGWLHLLGEEDQPYTLSHRGQQAAHSFHGLLRNYFEGYWLVLRATRYLQKKPYAERDFIKKVLSLGQKALKLELVERPECISKMIFGNALKFYVEKNIIEKVDCDKGKEKEQECYTDAGNRALIQHYSKQISRFLRSPHFALQ